uniref:Peptidase_M13_N domain-containing protein n=1 Tax=Panagrellus redivivus TaxID=6233 RepID=A0A7E4ZWH8_PANRE
MVNKPVKWLRILPTFLLAIFLTSQTAFAHDVYESIENSEAKAFGNRVCMNKDCVKLAAMFIQDRNDKVNPCEDFPAHICGNFKVNNNDPSYHTEGALILHRKLRRMIKSPPVPNEKPWYNLVRTFYKKCIDTASDIYPGLRVLLDEIGRWPALTAGTNVWTEFHESFEEYIANIHRKYRLYFFFKTIVVNVPVNETTKMNVIYILPAPMELNSSHLNDLSNHGSHFNPKPDSDLFDAELFETLTFHKANNALYDRNSASRQFHGPLSHYKEEFPNFDFAKYFTRLFDGIAPFDPETIVAFESAEYFRQFHKLLRPEYKRKVANYAGISVLQHLFDLRITKINKRIQTREANCFYLMYDDLLVYPISQMYVEKHVDRDVVQKVKEMVKLVKEELRESLETACWLDDKTRARALFKVDKMADSVGYPENLFNDTYVEENWNIVSDMRHHKGI